MIIGTVIAKVIAATVVYVENIGPGRGYTSTRQVAQVATSRPPPAAPTIGPICSIYDPEWDAMIGLEL